MKKIVLLFSCFAWSGFAQQHYTVKGKATTPDGYSPSGDVIALHPRDSVFISGTSFIDGSFELTNIKDKEILLKISSLEFNDTILYVSYNDSPTIDLGMITVETSGTALEEVVIKGQRPAYTQKDDGTLEIVVENTFLSTSNSVNEILTKSPEIISDEEGALSVFGKGSAILYLNGKRITDEQLALISPSNVKKIEIIRNPSAKYDAQGGAVINITTLEQKDEGYQASLKQNASYSDYGGWITNSGMTVNYKRGRFSSNAYYSLRLGKEKEVLHTTRDRKAENIYLKTDVTTAWNREFENYSNYGVGFQYDIDESSDVSVAYSGLFERLGGNQLSHNKITDDGGTYFYTSDVGRDEHTKNNSVSLNYNKSLDTLGASLFIGGQYSGFDVGADNSITEDAEEQNHNSSRSLKNLQDLDISVFSAQADFTKPFENSDALEIGAKFGIVKNDFYLDFLVADDGSDYETDPERSNRFLYDESIYAAYANFKSRLNKNTDYAIGIRGEYTKYDLQLSRNNNQTIKDHYFNIFPHVSVNMKLSEEYNLNFAYTSRIDRPRYQSLNPTLIYQDPYTSIQGNPELKPQKSHNFELGSKIRKTTVKIGYNYTIDRFGAAPLRGENLKSYSLTPINYDQQDEFFASVSRVFKVSNWWSSSNMLNLRYTTLTENKLDYQRVDPRPNVYFYTNNTFNITDSFNAELMFWYNGDDYGGLHYRKRMYNLTLSLGKSFFNNALKLSLIANDIFHGVIATGNYNVGQTDVYYNRRWSTDYFRVTVMYNFGRLKKVNYKNRSTGEPENNRAQ